MNKNVERVKELLSTIKSQLSKLEAIASDSQKDALAKIDGWTQDISAFQERVSEISDVFDYIIAIGER